MKYVYRMNGTYLGFISNGYLFSRDGEYLAALDENFLWDSSGRFRGQLVDINGHSYAVLNRFQVPPLPRIPKLKPLTPMLPNPPANIMPITLNPGLQDSF